MSYPVHMQRLAKPGKTLLGSDSHTCANGCMGMLAIGAGGIDVALAIAGEPFHVTMPSVWGVKLTGELSEWVELVADQDASYEVEEEIGLSKIEPLIAKPSSPGNVVPVKELSEVSMYLLTKQNK